MEEIIHTVNRKNKFVVCRCHRLAHKHMHRHTHTHTHIDIKQEQVYTLPHSDLFLP